MINISQTKYNVKYEDGNIKQIECEPTQIKKVISKSLNMAFENIILINANNNRMYSASNSFIQFNNTSIDLNVMDINQILRENLNSKKKVIELQNNVDDLQKEFVQLKETNREIINQLSQCKDNDQLIKKQRDQNFQELQRIEQQYKEKLMNQQQLYEQKITQINQNKEQLLSENEDLQRKIQELNNMVSKQERDFVNEKYFLQQQGDNQLNFNHQIYESQITKLEQEKQVMQNQIKQKNNLISQLESDIQEKGIFQQAQIQDLEDQQNRQEYYYKQNIQVLKQRINDINSSIDLSDNNNQNVIIKNYCNEAIREIDQIKKEMIDEEKNRNFEVQQKLKQQNNELQQKVEKLQKQIKTYTSQLKNAETDQHYQQQKFSNDIEQLNSQLKKVKKDLDSKQDEIRQLMLIKDQLQSENNELNKYNEKYERNIQQLSQTKAKQQSNIEELEEKYRLQHNQLLLSEYSVCIKDLRLLDIENNKFIIYNNNIGESKHYIQAFLSTQRICIFLNKTQELSFYSFCLLFHQGKNIISGGSLHQFHLQNKMKRSAILLPKDCFYCFLIVRIMKQLDIKGRLKMLHSCYLVPLLKIKVTQ